MQDHNLYPNMESICRLCLKENAGTVNIFPQDNKHSNMSIPMRIMSCSALEVQAHDGLPPKVCAECRYQLEKSYLFRKQSQCSDSKLRKHIRLLSLGKISKVFIKNLDEDEDDDEIEFKDSLDFIKEHDDKLKADEQLKFEHFREKLISENEIELKRRSESLKDKCKIELRSEVEQSVKTELREEVHKQLEEIMLPKMKKEWSNEIRENLREEVLEECRQSEMKSLLDDLQLFLKEKQRPQKDVRTNKSVLSHSTSLSSTSVDKMSVAKKACYSSGMENIEIVQVNELKIATHENKQDDTIKTIIKPELIMSESPSEEMDTNVNDDDGGDSDNFLIYDTDEGFELQKKTNAAIADMEDDNFIEEHGQAYDSSEEHLVAHEVSPKSTTTSYRIEDSENGEIKFLKKSTDPLYCHQTNDDNVDQLQDPNIMIINFPPEIEEEEHLEMVPFGEGYDSKQVKSVFLKGQPLKCYRPSEFSNISLPSQNVTTTIQTKFSAKTYVNTVQRATDTPKIFKCNSCPMVFSTNTSLERHLRTHRKGEETGINFQCPECQIVVSCASALRRHMYIHCNEKPFICKECGKSFVQKEILKRHMQTHTGIKPHQCPHCDRAFAQRINLKQHINRHHTEDPRIHQHTCHLCPKRFNHASGLSRHLASHSGVAFQCSECERTFGDRSSIKRHIANKHGNTKLPKSDKS